jgi:ABC-type dipeptide/oligopeptide/nickel transport system permease subunit
VARFNETRWQLGEEHLARLTAEAQRFRGESLGRDAWRRLRRSRPAFVALVFLGVFGLVSLLVPLLPLPSPVALSLRTRAAAPAWPWSAPLAPETTPEPGTAATNAMRNLWNDGWRHRSVAQLIGGDERSCARLLAHVRASLGGAVAALSAGDALFVAAPLDLGDTGRLERAVREAILAERYVDPDEEPGTVPPGRGFSAGSVRRVCSLAEVRHENGYWELGTVDRALVRLRTRLFGLGQTGNWLGTDPQGRDLLARILWGSRTSILVALMAAATSLLIGVTYGALSGYLGGRIDNLMMRIVDVLYSVPFIFIVIFLITVVNEYRVELEDTYGIDREVVFFVVIGAIYWLTMARVVRGQVLALKHTEFIQAARVMGASTPRILFLHLVPNVLSIVIVYLTLTIPAVMLFEAFLSFLGLGIEAPKVSWGILAKDGTEAITPIETTWWLVVFPALAMGSTLLALNVLGDGLRDALDPKQRGRS